MQTKRSAYIISDMETVTLGDRDRNIFSHILAPPTKLPRRLSSKTLGLSW